MLHALKLTLDIFSETKSSRDQHYEEKKKFEVSKNYFLKSAEASRRARRLIDPTFLPMHFPITFLFFLHKTFF